MCLWKRLIMRKTNRGCKNAPTPIWNRVKINYLTNLWIRYLKETLILASTVNSLKC